MTFCLHSFRFTSTPRMHICYNGEQQQQRQGDELVVPGPVLVVEDPLALLLVVHIAADKRTGSI